jgi:hypothetical protein
MVINQSAERNPKQTRKLSYNVENIENLISLHILKFVEKAKIPARICYRKTDEISV